jgi:hypothetical protein
MGNARAENLIERAVAPPSATIDVGDSESPVAPAAAAR